MCRFDSFRVCDWVTTIRVPVYVCVTSETFVFVCVCSIRDGVKGLYGERCVCVSEVSILDVWRPECIVVFCLWVPVCM